MTASRRKRARTGRRLARGGSRVRRLARTSRLGGLIRVATRFARVTGLGRLPDPETRPAWLDRLPGNRFALAALVCLALLALYGVASLSRPGVPTPSSAVRVPIRAATVVCPDTGGARLSAVTPPGPVSVGGVRATRPGSGTPLPVPLSVPGTSWFTKVTKNAGPMTVDGDGALAAGLTVEQTTSGGGLAGTRCPEPETDMWFAGPGPADAKDVAVSLTNVDPQPATVDIDGLGGDGSIETGQGQTSVAGRTTKVIHIGAGPEGLGDGATGEKLLALHVRAIDGRLAAAVHVQRKKGAEWLPATAPGTDLVIPGVPPGSGARKLLVAVPGNDVATVKVQAISSEGTSAAAGDGGLQATALTVTSLKLGIGGNAAGIRLTSDRPIVAALVADQGDDFAATAAAPALGHGGLVADDRAKTTLMFTAPGRPAAVRVTQLMAQGPTGTTQDVRVPAGRTVAVEMPPPAGADGSGIAIVPRPGSGPVYAARLLTIAHKGITLMPIPPARLSAYLPPVVDRTRP